MTTPWIIALCETLMNCNGRFRTLKNISPVIDSSGQPVFRVRSATIDFEIAVSGRRFMLRVPYGDNAANFEDAARQISPLKHYTDTPFVESRYLRKELTVFRGDGRAEHSDAILERLPDGVRLKEYIRINLHRKGRTNIRRLLDSYADIYSWLEEADAIHGHISADEIYVGEGVLPKLTNRIHLHGLSRDKDRISLIELSLLTYAAGCEPTVFPTLWKRQTQTEKSVIFQNIKVQAEFSRKPEIARAAQTLLSGEIPDAVQTEAILRGIASAKFADMTLLCGLLQSGNGSFGNCIMPPDADKTDMFPASEPAGSQSGGITKYRNSNGQWIYENNCGQSIGEAYDYAGDFYEGRAVVRTSEGYGLLGSDGKYLLEPAFEILEWYGSENIAVGSYESRYGVYDRMGRQMTIGIYDWIGEPSEDMIAVRRAKRYGYIDLNGREVIGLRYNEAFSFRDGKALVESNGKRYYIDHVGKRITGKSEK